MLNRRNNLFLLIASLFCMAWAIAPPLDPLKEQQRRGEKIYETGKSEDKTPIIAMMSGMEVPASVMPCKNCHGEKGAGIQQGDIMPPDISWSSLSKDKGERPAYDRKKLKKAITMGVKSNGKPLLKIMPKYNMSLEDMTCLVEYLKVLGVDNP